MVKGIADRCQAGVMSEVVTPSDSTNFTNGVARSLCVLTTGGDVAVVHPDGTVVIWPDVPPGFYIDVECIRVNSTGTDATGIIAVF